MNHLENCEHRVILCKNEHCNAQGNKAFIEDHKKKCRYRIIKCECKKEMVFHQFKKHIKEDCPEALVSCRYCEDKIKRKNFEEHQKKNGMLNALRINTRNHKKKSKQ